MSREPTWEEALAAAKRMLRDKGNALDGQVMDVLRQAGPDNRGRPVPEDLVLDAMAYLVRRGMARYHFSSAQLRITERGRRSLETVEWLEADDYVNEVREAAGGSLDPIIARYLREAKRAHEECLHLSCAVTLGCASEKAILLLANAAHPHLGCKSLSTAVRASRVQIGALFKDLAPRLHQYRADQGLTDAPPWDQLEDLGALFYQFRRHRNDSGHPTGRTPDHTDLTAYLASFKSYARILAGLLAYFPASTLPNAT